MEKKINIAELLKDFPKGMELYSPIYGLGILTRVTDRIYVKFPKEHNEKCFKHDGKVSEDGEIMLFPKGKTTWEGFQRLFRDGDIVATNDGSWIGITEGGEKDRFIPTYCVVKPNGEFEAYFDKKDKWSFYRLATEEEKEKLFKAIRDNGYKWNAETRTLEKLVESKEETEIKIDIPNGYEFFGIDDDNKIVLTKKQLQYPKTYEGCCKITRSDPDFYIDTHLYSDKLGALYKLLICRDAYWKIAGEQMGLGKSWKPDWENGLNKCCITVCENRIIKSSLARANAILAFPTEEMRDAFYDNFKVLIEQCKELL